jgi:membrane fusion protein (multidrug efflux system)
LIAAIGYLAWYVAGHWNRWAGAARFESTDDAYVTGDVTPLAAKISGYVKTVAVNDYQTVRKGELIVEIDPSDYAATLAQAEASQAAAQASLDNLANQKEVQRALIRQAEATIEATEADLTRYKLELKRQQDLLQTRIAGLPQIAEQAEANEKRTEAQLLLNKAQLDQQKALLASLDVQEKQLQAQLRGAEAAVDLARNNLNYTRITSPADGLVGQRQVRAGQFLNSGAQVIAVVPLPNIWVVANYKETQMTNIRIGETASITVDAFPDLKLTGQVDSWSPGTGSTFALLPPDNATGNFTKVVQRVPVKIVLDPHPALGALVRPGMSVIATIDTKNGEAAGSAEAAPAPAERK